MGGADTVVLDPTKSMAPRTLDHVGTQPVEGKSIENKKVIGITVNGIDFLELQKMKRKKLKTNVKTTPAKKTTLVKTTQSAEKNTKVKTTPAKKTTLVKTAQSAEKKTKVKTTPAKKTTLVKTVPSADKKGQITKYFKKKESEDNPTVEDNTRSENAKKLSFKPHHIQTGVRERIKSYENVINENGCVFMNGMCHKHKVSLTRHIKVRKVSVLGENGEVSWIRNEFAALKCPEVSTLRMISSADSDLIMSSDEREQSTNKKARNSTHGEKDQPASDKQPGD